MLRPFTRPTLSSREAIRAALLLRAVDRDHARGHDLYAGEQIRHPVALDGLGLHPHRLREHTAIDREGDVAHADEHALREQLVHAHAGDRKVAGLRLREWVAQAGPLVAASL